MSEESYTETQEIKMEFQGVKTQGWVAQFKYPLGVWATSNLGILGLIDFAGINGLGEKEYLLRPKAVDNKTVDAVWVNEKHITLI
jgi:hypothetical protein